MSTMENKGNRKSGDSAGNFYDKNQLNSSPFDSKIQMERKLFKSYDKEYMRTAMLKHEEIFKQQVCELHRLYRIQKILMSSVDIDQSNGQKRDRWIVRNENDRNQHKDGELTAESDGDEIDEREIELTLGPSIYYGRRKTQKPSYSGQSASSSSTGSSQIMRRTATNSKNCQKKDGVGFVNESEERLKQENNLDGGNLRQEELKQQHPPRLFDALSLKWT
ncbi:hypothetical protein Nepgr_016669 [Nepenthes gracilis]|uniref:Uncharacterized protein n=1 Tax=Nepenthes gracilis TaxID=150966 RepID=A0AAD3SP06_NEPGR|nr:hypothetical protein Nepgr_016669 [Nepenthes gracilis]